MNEPSAVTIKPGTLAAKSPLVPPTVSELFPPTPVRPRGYDGGVAHGTSLPIGARVRRLEASLSRQRSPHHGLVPGLLAPWLRWRPRRGLRHERASARAQQARAEDKARDADASAWRSDGFHWLLLTQDLRFGFLVGIMSYGHRYRGGRSQGNKHRPNPRALIERIRATGVPVIHFGTGASGFFKELHAAGGDVMGVDWRVNID